MKPVIALLGIVVVSLGIFTVGCLTIGIVLARSGHPILGGIMVGLGAYGAVQFLVPAYRMTVREIEREDRT